MRATCILCLLATATIESTEKGHVGVWTNSLPFPSMLAVQHTQLSLLRLSLRKDKRAVVWQNLNPPCFVKVLVKMNQEAIILHLQVRQVINEVSRVGWSLLLVHKPSISLANETAQEVFVFGRPKCMENDIPLASKSIFLPSSKLRFSLLFRSYHTITQYTPLLSLERHKNKREDKPDSIYIHSCLSN